MPGGNLTGEEIANRERDVASRPRDRARHLAMPQAFNPESGLSPRGGKSNAMSNDKLSEKQGYLAMFAFLDELYSKYGYSQLGSLLGSMTFFPDGSPVDHAIWNDWLRAIEKVKSDQVDATLTLKHLTDQSDNNDTDCHP